MLGGSRKWIIKSFARLRKQGKHAQEKTKTRMKWNFLRIRSRRPEPVRVQVADASLVAVSREWAALRIQTAFRSFLARRALCALKGIVRLQALVRGWLARKRAVAAFKCLQALVRVEARARAQQVSASTEELRDQVRSVRDAEDGWCDSRCTVESIKAKLQMRRDGARKRERAMAYSLRNMQRKAKLNEYPTSSSTFVNEQELMGINSSLRRLKPWEERFMEGTEESSSLGKEVAQCKSTRGLRNDKEGCRIVQSTTSGFFHYETFPSSSSFSSSSLEYGNTLIASENTEASHIKANDIVRTKIQGERSSDNALYSAGKNPSASSTLMQNLGGIRS